MKGISISWIGTFNKRIINLASKHITWSIILVYNLITVSIIAAFYNIIPTLLNYPPNNEEVSQSLGISNISQYVVITAITVILGTVILLWFFRGVDKWQMLDPGDPQNVAQLRAIRIKCLNLPNVIFLHQILIMLIPLSILLFAVATINRISYLAPLKIILLVTSFFTLAAVITQMFSKKIFKIILTDTYTDQEQEGMKLGLRKKIFLQVFPLLIIAILYTSLIGYSRLINEKGELIFSILSSQLQEATAETTQISDFDDAFRILKNVRLTHAESYFVVQSPQGVLKTSDGSLPSGYLTYFIEHPYESTRLYDINAEVQGAIKEVHTDSGTWKVGVVFHVASSGAVQFFIIGFLIILSFSIFVLSYFSKSLSRDIALVSENLTGIAEGNPVKLDIKIPVTSNDEIGDLVVAFNKILNREKEQLQEVEEKHDAMMEKEQLASLGYLMAGITENMRTSILLLSGGIEGLGELVRKVEESIGNPVKTKEEHQKIIREMTECLQKMKGQSAYMSNIVTTVSGQTIPASNSKHLNFTLDSLGERIEILLSQELKKQHCSLEIDFSENEGICIKGEQSAMLQVLSNLILNSMQAYGPQGGIIELKALVENGIVLLMVTDHANGIPDTVKDKLFKEMVTTKGKNGTGLGLYMSCSNIKARFGGKMWFETERNVGTTFFVQVPVFLGEQKL